MSTRTHPMAAPQTPTERSAEQPAVRGADHVAGRCSM
jgi:hypothetical protein